MLLHPLRTFKSSEPLPREEQLAWKIAEVAADPVAVDADVADMIVNRFIDNASVAVASLKRAPIVAARGQAQAHPVGPASGEPARPCSASTAGTGPSGPRTRTASRCASSTTTTRSSSAEYSHPGDNIPPILAVAQHVGADGAALVRGIATGYEIQVDLVKSISLHAHKIDHVAHLGPSAAAGIGTLLGLPVETIYQAIGQALHTTTATRQSRKGEISTWKASAPAFAGKMAIEAVDRAMRGQTSPSPIWEGEDGVIAWLLDGPEGRYEVPLPEKGESKRAILDTYTKEHSAEYQAQAWIDLARALGPRHPEIRDPAQRRADRARHQPPHALRDRYGRERPAEVRPRGQPRDPRPLDRVHLRGGAAGRRPGTTTLSYAPERATRPDTVALWHKISTVEDPEWTRRYHSNDLAEKAFGGRVEIDLVDGGRIVDEIARRRRAPARRAPVHAARLRAQVPHARRVRCSRRVEIDALPRPRASGCRRSPRPRWGGLNVLVDGLPEAPKGLF